MPFTSCSSAASGPLVVRTVDAPLKTGDYSIQGYEDLVTVEQTSHQDLVASDTHGRRRFEAGV